jgi:hypothetical protein
MGAPSVEGLRLWHGGVPGLRPGDLIEPGYERQYHDGCPFCEARRAQAAGGDVPVLDGLAEHPDQVYLTPVREYARFYASLWGRGDLYRVDPVGEVEGSTEDTMESYRAPAARVVAVVERAVLLTMGQRRRLDRLWGAADAAARVGSAALGG